MIERVQASDATASLLAVPPQDSFHVVDMDGGRPRSPASGRSASLPLWENGGYFVLRPDIFDDLHEGEDLVDDAFPRLARQGRLHGRPSYNGLLGADGHAQGARLLEDLHPAATAPWMLWARQPDESCRPSSGSRRSSRRSRAGRGVMLGLTFGERRRACWRSAPTPTTSRSGAAARCCGSRSAGRALPVTVRRADRHAAAAATRRAPLPSCSSRGAT